MYLKVDYFTIKNEILLNFHNSEHSLFYLKFMWATLLKYISITLILPLKALSAITFFV